MKKKNYTLGKKYKIFFDRDFRGLQEKGKAIYQNGFKIIYLVKKNDKEETNPFLPEFKWAIKVPKKLIKKAVLRNRIKRLVHEVFRHQAVELKQVLEDKSIYLHLLLIYRLNTVEDIEFYKKNIMDSLKKIYGKIS